MNSTRRQDSLPPHRVVTCIPEKREPGMILFNVRPGGSADLTGKYGWVLGLDQDGTLPLCLDLGSPVQDIRKLPNGNLIFGQTGKGLISEFDSRGHIHRQWHARGKWADGEPPKNSIELDVELFHHTVNVLSNGNFLLLSAEVRDFDNWPQNDSEPDAPRGPARVVGDVVMEISPEGTTLNRWAMLDMLDPYRLCYGSCNGYWRPRGFPDSFDWCHANSVFADPSDDTILVSLRTQDCIIKFSRQTGELIWIHGDHGNWKSPWSEKLLSPQGEIAWQYHQHDCSITPAGTLLCFDNGNYRNVPFGEKVEPEESTSRVVEFRIDETKKTVSQHWSYEPESGDGQFACYQGGALRLPKTGNTFMTFGGVCTIDGRPTDKVTESFTRSRLLEVSPENEIVFEMWIDGSDENPPMTLSSFRSEHLPLETAQG